MPSLPQPNFEVILSNGLPFGAPEFDGNSVEEVEAIEHCSDQLLPLLLEHTSHKTGRLEAGELVERRIDAARWRLYGEDHDWAVIDSGHKWAAQLVAEHLVNIREEVLQEQLGDGS